MYINDRGQGEGRIIIQCYNNCSEPGYNIYIYKKDEEMSNVYSSD